MLSTSTSDFRMEAFEAESKLNEFEDMFYSFTAKGFTDTVHNCLIESWAEAVDEVFLKGALSDCPDKEKAKEGLMELFFRAKSGGVKVASLLEQFTEHARKFTFRIPDSVTLPCHLESLKLEVDILNGKDFDMDKEARVVRKLEKEIIDKRFTLEYLSRDLKEAEDVIEVMQFMLKKLDDRAAKLNIANEVEESMDETNLDSSV